MVDVLIYGAGTGFNPRVGQIDTICLQCIIALCVYVQVTTMAYADLLQLNITKMNEI